MQRYMENGPSWNVLLGQTERELVKTRIYCSFREVSLTFTLQCRNVAKIFYWKLCSFTVPTKMRQGRGKVVPVFIYAQLHEGVWGGGCSSNFLHLSIRWKSVVSFTSRPLYPRKTAAGIPWIWGWVGLRGGVHSMEKMKFLIYGNGIPTPLVIQPVTLSYTELFRLTYSPLWEPLISLVLFKKKQKKKTSLQPSSLVYSFVLTVVSKFSRHDFAGVLCFLQRRFV
jgi:hypothetical protein